MPQSFLKTFVLSRMTLVNVTARSIAERYGCSVQQVYKVLDGHVSAGLRQEIASACGFKNWKELTTNARAAYRTLKRDKLVRA